MIPLILTILCSTSIALILKQNDSRGGNTIVLLCGNYFVASIVSFYFLLTANEDFYSAHTLLFGTVLGLFFVVTFFAYARAVGVAGTALATVSSRLSVIVPLVLSVFIFTEKPDFYQFTGFIFTAITIFLFYKSLNTRKTKEIQLRSYLYLIVVLVGIGINDFCMKIFQEWRPPAEKPLFLFTIFTSAFVLTLIIILVRNTRPEPRVIRLGLLLGIPNVFSTFFILAALTELAAIIVFPVTNIGIILLTSFLVLLIWKEKLNRFGQLALLTGVVAIVLLGI